MLQSIKISFGVEHCSVMWRTLLWYKWIWVYMDHMIWAILLCVRFAFNGLGLTINVTRKWCLDVVNVLEQERSRFITVLSGGLGLEHVTTLTTLQVQGTWMVPWTWSWSEPDSKPLQVLSEVFIKSVLCSFSYSVFSF